MPAYLGVFLATAAVTLFATPLVRRLAIRVKAIDYPSDRKVHPKPTPTLGGLAILLGVLVGLGVAWLTPALRPAFRFSSELQGALLAGVAIAVVGVVDDLKTLSAPAKVAGQILAAGLLVLNGVELIFFWFPSQGVISLGADMAVPLTVLWVLIVVNAVNLIDGLDGLAAGIVAIAAGAFFVYAHRVPPASGQPLLQAAPILCAVVAGAALGFLPHNFHPARIIMGDTRHAARDAPGGGHDLGHRPDPAAHRARRGGVLDPAADPRARAGGAAAGRGARDRPPASPAGAHLRAGQAAHPSSAPAGRGLAAAGRADHVPVVGRARRFGPGAHLRQQRRRRGGHGRVRGDGRGGDARAEAVAGEAASVRRDRRAQGCGRGPPVPRRAAVTARG